MLREFDIQISKLNFGQYIFNYKIDDRFFELFEYSLIEKGTLSAEVILDKKTDFIQLTIALSGIIELQCDRSLDEFDFPLSSQNQIILKFGDEEQEISDEVEIIAFGKPSLNVARYIYEYISLEIPMKKLHPRYETRSDDGTLIDISGDSDKNLEETDPRWNKLKKLKNKD